MTKPVKNAADATARAYAVLKQEEVERELDELLLKIGEWADLGRTSLTNHKVSARGRIALGERLTAMGFSVTTNMHSPYARSATLNLSWPPVPQDWD